MSRYVGSNPTLSAIRKNQKGSQCLKRLGSLHFLVFQASHNDQQMEKRKAANRFQRRRTLRFTAEEDERIAQQADTAGISVSEYMRRLFFGGRPIIARTDDQTIRELRRLGGLLKHHFDVVKQTGNAATLAELDAALREVRRAIEALSERR